MNEENDWQFILESIWGKTIHDFHNNSIESYPLIRHLIDSGAVALELFEVDGGVRFNVLKNAVFGTNTTNDHDSFKKTIAFLIALHDIGKCTPMFQSYQDFGLSEEIPLRESGGDPNFRHEYFSEGIIHDIFIQTGNRDLNKIKPIKSAISQHHSRIRKTSTKEEGYEKQEWVGLREKIISILKDIFEPDLQTINSLEKYHRGNIVYEMFLGFTIMADWISSNNDLFLTEDYRNNNKLLDEFIGGLNKQENQANQNNYLSDARKQAKIVLNNLGLTIRYSFPENYQNSFSHLFHEFQNLRPIQKMLEELVAAKPWIKSTPGMFIIETFMGEGKTEVAQWLCANYLYTNSLNGFYFALPTMATSDQMYNRVNDFIQEKLNAQNQGISRSEIRLVHGMSWMRDDILNEGRTAANSKDNTDYQDQSHNWFAPLRRALLAPFGIGTIDQILLSILNVRFGTLRLFGLANKVIVFDEIHAYDTFTFTIIEFLLKWLGAMNIPVILLSATLPNSKKLNLIKAYNPAFNGTYSDIINNYPLISYIIAANSTNPNIDEKSINSQYNQEYIQFPINGIEKNQRPNIPEKRINVQLLYHNDLEPIANSAIDSAKNGRCICVIMNSVGKTQKLTDIIIEKLKNENINQVAWYGPDEINTHVQNKKKINEDKILVILFHARFRVEERKTIQDFVLRLFSKDVSERPKKAIIIATQVVEQSLDIDFDEMISEFAPLDLLFQRVGRVQRFNIRGRSEPKLVIAIPDHKYQTKFKKSVYHPLVLIRSYLTLLQILKETEENNFKEFTLDIVENIRKPNIVYDIDENLLQIPELYREVHDNAMSEYRNEMKAYSELARQGFINHDPLAEKYSIDLGIQLKEEEEAMSDSNIRAQTRFGDKSIRVIALNHDNVYIDQLRNVERKINNWITAKNILKNMVQIPDYWIKKGDMTNPNQIFERKVKDKLGFIMVLIFDENNEITFNTNTKQQTIVLSKRKGLYIK